MASASDDGVSQGVIEKVVDLPTDYADHMHEPSDTSMLGRVITDKTVRSVGFDAIDRETGAPINPTDIGDNFTVTFSALSSGGDVPGGGNSVPVDIVLVLDVSRSMVKNNVSSGTTRAAAMVDAANEAIKKIMESNDENRVAVVAYSSATTTLIPLQSLNNITGNYLTINNRSASSGVTITPNASIAGASSVSVTGSTNTQAGVYVGMNQLLTADPEVTIAGKEYSRIPGVILMSDGGSSTIYGNSNWWEATSSDGTQGAAREDSKRFWGNGYVAMLEAEYMKSLVAEHYDGDCSIFTVGLGLRTAVKDNYERLVLDPSGGIDATNWSSGTTTPNVPALMRAAFSSFTNGSTHQVPYGGSLSSITNYTVTVPTETANPEAYAHKPKTLKYNDAYYSADSVATLVDAFTQAIEAISEKAYDPTSTDKDDETGETSGHVTFIDTLGTFMEVKDFKSILWVDHDPSSQPYGERIEFTAHSKTSSGAIDTYVFSGSTHSSWRYNYAQVPLRDIIITVDKSGSSDVVTIQVPPALLPMVEYTVKENGEGEITEAWRNEETAPIKINYEVGPKEGVVDYIAGTSDGSSLDAALKEDVDAYIANDSNYVTTNGGRGVALYTNDFTGSGVPAASFEINAGNSYYSFTQKTPLYLDSAGTTPATEFEAGKTYYYKQTVYNVSSSQSSLPAEPIAQDRYLPVTSLTSYDVMVDGGQLFAKAHTDKDLPAGQDKILNATETLGYRYTSRWYDGTNVMQLQGNNGRLVIQRPGNLQLEKIITLAEGLDAAGIAIDQDAMNAKQFTFSVELDEPSTSGGTTSYSALAGSYDYVIQNPSLPEAQWVTGTIENGRATIQLTQNETLLIKNLPDGTRYTLNETGSVTGYTLISSTTTYLDENGASQTVDGASASGYQLVGYIASSSTSTASFTNEYGFNDEGISIENRPHVKKTLENTTFDDNSYQFFMTIAPYDDNPAPVELAATQVEVSLDAVGRGEATQLDSSNIDSYFKGITFHAPGTYWFRIAERNNAIPGMTYSQSVYAYVVQVHDNGDGTMSIDTDVTAQHPDITMQKVIDIDGTSVPAGEGTIDPTRVDNQDVLEATFTNTYSVEEITIGTPGLKTYTDNSGANPLTADMFQFELRPSFYDANGDPLTQAEVDAVPMPDGTPDDTYTESDTGNNLTYTKKDTFNAASGDFGFGTITYGLDDAGNEYRYVVQEIIPNTALANGMRHYVSRADESDTVDTTDDHGYLWHEGDKIYDLKTISYQGMVYDCSRHVVVVAVSQETTDGVTHIVADVQYQTPTSLGMQEVVINNVYTPDPVNTDDDTSTGNNILVTKTLTGRDSAAGESFSFQIAAAGVNSREGLANDTIVFDGDVDATTMQASTSGTLTDGEEQEVFFNNITFKRAGSYTFAISEVVPAKADRVAGVSYDQHTANVVVEVALNQDEGKLYIQSVTPTADGATAFTNSYSAEPVEYGSVGALEIGKLVDGRAMAARKYSFTVEAQNDEAKAKNEAAGLDEIITVLNSSAAADGVEQETATLTGLAFTLDDVGKTFTYKVSEVVPSGADANRKFEGITYAYDDLIEQFVSYAVADNADGTLSVTATVTDGDGNELGTFVSSSDDISPAITHFKNKYTVDPLTVDTATVPFSKIIEGRDWKEGDAFSFTLEKSPSTAPDPERSTASLTYEEVQDGNTSFDFGNVTFTKAGTYTYTVTEDQSQGAGNGITNDPASRSVRVVVTDNNVGGLTARVEAINSLTFVNTYSATQDFVGIDVSKTLTGRSMREREFMIDLRPIDAEGGDDGVVYASAEETAEVFGVRKTGEIVIINRPETGETQIENVIPAVTLTEAQAGMVYAFEVKEFVPSYAEDAELDGKTYKMRDGVYYNTLGEGFNHWRFEIAVTDDTNGNLTTAVTWIAHDEDHNVIDTVEGDSVTNPEEAPVVPFENTYRAIGTATINAIKDLEGRDWTDADAFEFEISRMKLSDDGSSLEEDDGSLTTPLPSGKLTAKKTTDLVGSDGTQHHAVSNPDADPDDYVNGWKFDISQDDLTVDPADNIKKGDFYYKIVEVVPADEDADTAGIQKDGITYSETPRYVHVHAEDTRTGTIATTVEYVSADAPDVSLGATPVFTNRYNPSGELQIPVIKVLVGRDWTDADSYTFTIERLNNSYPEPAEPASVTIDANTENYSDKFGAITFTKAGTYNYLITEEAGSVAGVTYDANPARRVRVVVSDAGDGTLSIDSITYYTDAAYAEQQSDQDKAVFTNTYKATSDEIDTNDSGEGEGTGIFSTTKLLAGRDFRSGDSFAFTIEGSAGAPLPSVATAEVAPVAGTDEATFGFGTIEFTEADAGKTYTYTIREVLPEDDDPDTDGVQYEGVTFDEHAEQVEVTLTDNGEGKIIVTASNDGEVSFTNSYNVSGTAEIKAIKDLRGRDWTDDDAFEFTIGPVKVDGASFADFSSSDEDQALLATYPENVTEYPAGQDYATAVRDANQQVAIGQYFAVPAWNFDITQDNLDATTGIGDFYYRITEVLPEDEDRSTDGVQSNSITYSEEIYYAHIHAVDDGKGTIKTTLTYETAPGEVKGATPVFTNVYESPTANIAVTKSWEGDSENTDGRTDVVVHLYYLDTTTNTYKQADVEPLILATGSNHGEELTGSWDVPIYGADGTTKIVYKVLEEAVAGYRASYTGNENIELTEGEVSRVGIENSIDETTTSVAVTKVWDDASNQDGMRPAQGDFTITLLADDTAVRTTTLTGSGDTWTGEFANLPATRNGKTIVYTVQESVPGGYTQTSITGCQSQGYTITNTHETLTTSVSVNKVWDDNNDADGRRPNYAEFELLANGQPLTPSKKIQVTGDDTAASWTGSIEGLPTYANGSAITYTWRETSVAGYTAKVDGEETNVVLNAGTVVNEYHAKASASIRVSKEITGRAAWRPNDVFTFTLETVNTTNSDGSIPVPGGQEGVIGDTSTITIDSTNATHSAAFAELHFNQTGTYVYKLTENEHNVPNVGHDDTVYYVKVVTTDADSDGVFETSVGYFTDEDCTQAATNGARFVNAFSASGAASLRTIKDLHDREWRNSDSFQFVIEPYGVGTYSATGMSVDTNDAVKALVPMPADTTANATNNDSLKLAEGQYFADPTWTVTYTQDNLTLDPSEGVSKGDFFYRIREVKPSDQSPAGTDEPGMTYDATPQYAHVHVTYNGSGQLVTAVYYNESTLGDMSTAKGATPVFTNTWQSPDGDIEVTKEWKGDSDDKGGRTDVVVHLYRVENGTLVQADVAPLTLATGTNHEGDLTKDWSEMPKQYEDGTYITYQVVEEPVAGYIPGYAVQVGGTDVTGTQFTLEDDDARVVITNSHDNEGPTTSVSGEKVWIDKNNADSTRPANISISLKANGADAVDATGTVVDDATVTAADNWKWEFTNLPIYDANGKKIVYTMAEATVDGYTKNELVDGKVIINTLATTSASVTKVWSDNSNQDGTRPETITFKLLANGSDTGKTLTLTGAGDTWTGTLEGLPTYTAAGDAITYTFEESAVSGYTVTVDGATANVVAAGGTITNSHTSQTIDIPVSKTWVDGENQDGLRAPVDVVLVANGVETANTLTLSSSNNWAGTFERVAKYANGTEIAYTVREASVPDGYTATVSGSVAGFTITNTHTPETISIFGSKTWLDDGTGRPGSITVKVQKNTGTQAAPVWTDVESKTVNFADNGWDFVFTGLAKYAGGNEIAYQVVEEDVDGYESVFRQDATDGTWTIVNTATITVAGIKTWVGGADSEHDNAGITIELLANGQSLDPAVTETPDEDGSYSFGVQPVYDGDGNKIDYSVREQSVPDGYADSYPTGTFDVVNTATATRTIEVTKTWNDGDADPSTHPEVSFTVLADGEAADTIDLAPGSATGDKATSAELPVYDSATGNEITYIVEEQPVDGYIAGEMTGDMNDGFAITNTLATTDEPSDPSDPANVGTAGSKTWVDAGKNDRPASITIRLLANGAEIASKTVTPDENDVWNWSFAGYPAYDDNGEKITYNVSEDRVPGYTASVDGMNVTNTRSGNTTAVYVQKVWDDDGGRDGKRTESVTVELLANDESLASPQTLTLQESNSWRGNFSGLAGFDAQGKPITYTVRETHPPEGYTSSITGSGSVSDPYVVTNTYGVDTMSITVYKVWDDANDQDGVRPDDVTISLKAGDSAATDATGEPVADLKLDDSNNWTGTFTNLLVNEDGSPIDYIVEEGNDPNYTPKIEYGDAAGEWSEAKPNDWNYKVRITNTHTPETHDVPVDPQDPEGEKRGIQATKVWSDTDANLRSDVTLHLYGRVDGRIVYEGEDKTIAKDAQGDALTVSWSGAPVNLNGETIEYEVVEDAIAGYTSSVSGNVDDGFTVTNTFSEPTTTITATKVWDDNDNVDGLRDEVQFKLVRTVGGGQKEDVETSAKFADDGHTVTWEDLPATLPQETSTTTTDPETGEEVTETAVEETAVLYSVEEVGTPEGYEAIVVATAPGKFEVRNIHVPETIGDVDGPTDPSDPDFKGIKAAKVWSDDNNANKNRPAYAMLTLQQRAAGEDDDAWADYGESKAAREAGDWQVGWTGLPKNASMDVAYEYRVIEKDSDVPAGYTAALSGTMAEGFTITNTFNAMITVRATKTWYDTDGETVIDESPEAITLHLKKRVGDYGEVEVDSKTIEADASGEALTAEWADMPSTENGLPITYLVTEDELEDYEFSVGDGVLENDVLTISVTNTKKVPEPEPPVKQTLLVSFVDPFSAAGNQVAKFQAVTEEQLADLDALKPTDPDHAAEGKNFQQWDKNESTTTLNDGTEAKLVTYVARFTDTSAGKKTVSYVSGQAASGSQLVKSEMATDPSSVTPPTENPTAANMAFAGWEGPIEDAAGNQIYVAKFASDCRNEPLPPEPDPSSDSGSGSGQGGSSASGGTSTSSTDGAAGQSVAKTLPDTGDNMPVASLVTLAILGFAAFLFARRTSLL